MASYRLFQLRRRIADSLRSNYRSEKDDAVLQAASDNDIVRITQYLNESYSPLDLRTDERRSLLHLAAMGGHVAMLTLLLSSPKVKKRINTHDKAFRTALHLAAAVGYDVCVRTLTAAGAAVNARDEEGRTPLHLAIMFAWPEAVKALLEVNANTAIEDAYGKNAVDLAQEAQDGEVSALMMPFGDNRRSMGNPLLRCLIPQRSKASCCKGLANTNAGPADFPADHDDAGAAGRMTAAQEQYHRSLQSADEGKRASSTATADTADGASGPEEGEEEEDAEEEASEEAESAPEPAEQAAGDQLGAAIAAAAREHLSSPRHAAGTAVTEEPEGQQPEGQQPEGQQPASVAPAIESVQEREGQQVAPAARSQTDVKIQSQGAADAGDAGSAAAGAAAGTADVLAAAPRTPRAANSGGGGYGSGGLGADAAAVAPSPAQAEQQVGTTASARLSAMHRVLDNAARAAAEEGAIGAVAAVYDPPPCTAVFLLRAQFGEEVQRLEFDVEWLEEGPAVGNIHAGGAADTRGLQQGDFIAEINGETTAGRGRTELLPLLKARPLVLDINRSAEVLDAQLQPHIELTILVGGACDDRGFDVGCFGQVPAVCTVRAKSQAHAAGLLEGDAIVAANSCRAGKSSQAALLAEFQRRPLQLTVWRRPLGEDLAAPWALDPENARWCEMPSKTVRGGDLTDSEGSGDEEQ